MVAAMKAVLAAIISVIIIYLLTQLAFFFPFYMTVVVETFNLSNVAANDNYVKETYYNASLDSLRDRPVFRKDPDSVRIEVFNSDGRNAVGDDDEFSYFNDSIDPVLKPYRQRGEPVRVRVSAMYPVEIKLWGQPVPLRSIPVTFEITTIGLRYYKDLML